jgi:hypothetical protein
VTDKIIATGQTLAEWTANSEWRSKKRTYTGSQYKSPAGCGATSVYDVAWTLKRLRTPIEQFKVTPEYKNLIPGEIFEFHVDPQNIPVRWSVDGLGSGEIATDFGTYKAPDTAFPNSLVVVRATATDKSGRYAFGFVRVVPKFDDMHNAIIRTGPPLFAQATSSSRQSP